MSNFDAKFGPAPVHPMDECSTLAVQFVCVFVFACAIHPSFLSAPRTSELSYTLVAIFSLLTIVATVCVQRSFIPHS